MAGRWRSSIGIAIGALVLVCFETSAAAAQGWTPKRTPDGQPDIQGTWVNFDDTPFEAPLDNRGPATQNPGVNPAPEFAIHNSPVNKRRTAMVVDPPNGRIPVLKWAEDKRDYDLAHIPDAPEHETPWVRCITRGHPAGMFPAGYNNAYRIIQTPGFVIMAFEMIHETRIIPIDGRPRLGEAIRQWSGEPRGRWEGDTLVVESTNYNDKGSIATSAATGRMRGIPQSETMRVIERFTPVDANAIQYSVTIEDPKVYSRPWTVALPLNRDESYEIFEYSCHEGNYALPNALRYGRMRDREAGSR